MGFSRLYLSFWVILFLIDSELQNLLLFLNSCLVYFCNCCWLLNCSAWGLRWHFSRFIPIFFLSYWHIRASPISVWGAFHRFWIWRCNPLLIVLLKKCVEMVVLLFYIGFHSSMILNVKTWSWRVVLGHNFSSLCERVHHLMNSLWVMRIGRRRISR